MPNKKKKQIPQELVTEPDLSEEQDSGIEEAESSEESKNVFARFFDQIQRKEANKATSRSRALQKEREVLFSKAQDLLEKQKRIRDAYIEDLRTSLTELKVREIPANAEAFRRLRCENEESFQRLFSNHTSYFEEVKPLRKQTIEATSASIRQHSEKRGELMKRARKNAREEVRRRAEEQKNVTDGRSMAKNLKALLTS